MQCSFAGCDRKVHAHGLCSPHDRQRREGRKLAPLRVRLYSKIPEGLVCSFEGCDRPIHAKGLCHSHDGQSRKGNGLTPLPAEIVPLTRYPPGDWPRCRFDGCTNPSHGKDGLCGSHNSQIKSGKPLTPIRQIPDGPCSFEGCDRKPTSTGFCPVHMAQKRRGKEMTPINPRLHQKIPEGLLCSFDGCGRPYRASGLCATHNQQRLTGGELRPILLGSSSPNGKVYRREYPFTDSYGYVWIKPEPGKPAIQEHRAVMSEMLGRPLLPGESPHHKNLVRHDNRPSNLELWVSSQPSGARASDLVVWAKEILALYDNETVSSMSQTVNLKE